MCKLVAYLLCLRQQTEVNRPFSQGFSSRSSHLLNMCTSTSPGGKKRTPDGQTPEVTVCSVRWTLTTAPSSLSLSLFHSPSLSLFSLSYIQTHSQTHPSSTTSAVAAPPQEVSSLLDLSTHSQLLLLFLVIYFSTLSLYFTPGVETFFKQIAHQEHTPIGKQAQEQLQENFTAWA